jgi:hypothetical protein
MGVFLVVPFLCFVGAKQVSHPPATVAAARQASRGEIAVTNPLFFGSYK